MEEISVIYKGWRIVFVEDSWEKKEYWVLVDDDNNRDYKNEKLKVVKEYIDRLNKKDFKQFEIYHRGWRGGYHKFIVTSINEDGDLWIKTSQGRRQKIRADQAVILSDENDSIIKEILDIENTIKQLNNNLSLKSKELKTYK